MKKRSIFILTLTMALSACAFAACGGKTSASPSDSSPVSSSESAKEYTVTFVVNGGSEIAAATVKEGEKINVSDYVPEKDGSWFYGWFSDETLTSRVNNEFIPAGDMKLYAAWGEEEKYTLSFNTTGGSEVEAKMYRPNAPLAQPEEPTRENYVFAGWYRDEACTKEFSFLGANMIRSDITLYAKWTEVCAICLDTAGGNEMARIEGKANDRIAAPADPVKEGYIFDGWYADAEYTEEYEFYQLPDGIITVYAKWHEQQKDVEVRLHINSPESEEDTARTASGNEGEDFDGNAAIAEFKSTIAEQTKSKFFSEAEAATEAENVYRFGGWAYADGKLFAGELPAAEHGIDLYAVWTRSTKYSKVIFSAMEEGEADKEYFVKKNTAIDKTYLDGIKQPIAEKYLAQGCVFDGFYTSDGFLYDEGQTVDFDMVLVPNIHSVDLEYEYSEFDLGEEEPFKGYILKGYKADSEVAKKDGGDLTLIIPLFHNDEVHGSMPVIWIGDGAFADYPVARIDFTENIVGIGARAFANTKLSSVELPQAVLEIGDYAFENSESLASFSREGNGFLTLGIKIFRGTPFEATLPRENGFVFFDEGKQTLYSYEGTETEITIPDTVVLISGGAFYRDAVVRSVNLNKVMVVLNSAFEESGVEEAVFGGSLIGMSGNIFKNSKNLKTAMFERSQLQVIGASAFEGCTSLETVDLSDLPYLVAINSYAFAGCTNLQSVAMAYAWRGANNSFVSNFRVVSDHAFEGCSSLTQFTIPVYTQVIGEYAFASSAIKRVILPYNVYTVGKGAFENCKSLRRISLYADLANDEIVSFGEGALSGAGFTKNGSFTKTAIYVRNGEPDYKEGSKWAKDETTMFSYVEIYQKSFEGTDLADNQVKEIEEESPTLEISQNTFTLEASETLAAFDIIAYLQEQGVLHVEDNVSKPEDCEIEVYSVTFGEGEGARTLQPTDGKYDFSEVGIYTVVVVAYDEYGNITSDEDRNPVGVTVTFTVVAAQ